MSMQGSTRAAAELRFERVASPLGDLLVYSTQRGVCALDFADLAGALEHRLQRRYGRFTASAGSGSGTARRLAAYFRGDFSALEDCPIDPGGTPFQIAAWQAMRRVAPGDRKTYTWLARCVGRPRAVRAVGAASARNPIALLIPCHRIVGVDGSLVGYAGGVGRKRWLLDHERAALTASPS
jgi:methylated-DNA-[protein]-cysteine S-methyltransferase